MHKLLASIKKEILLLMRDWGGLGILFIMPSILLVTITLIQQSTFREAGNSVMPIVLVNNDGGELGKTIEKNISETESLKLIQKQDGKTIDEITARKLVSSGKYQIALVIPENLSAGLESRINANVEKILAEFSWDESDSAQTDVAEQPQEKLAKIKLYFDPAAGETFRNSVKNDIEKMMSKVESKKIYTVFEEQMGIETEGNMMDDNAIQFEEIIAQKGEDGIVPNTVQHNVPAWI